MIANEQVMGSRQVTSARNGVRIKTIALPAEHGGWGFLLEPIALGLLVAPSIGGFYLAICAVGLFLARQPLTLVVLNRRRTSPRTMLAKRFATLYLSVALLGFIAAIVFSRHSFIMPLLIATPLAAAQVAYDWSGRRRILLPEIAGAIAIASLAPAITLSSGWSRSASFALWAIMIARAVPAILYVRTCLARLHQRKAAPVPMLVAHLAAVAIVAVMARAGVVPLLAAAAMVILLGRAIIGFELKRVTAKQIGFSEIAFGALTVFAVAFGISFHL
jgi:hypothetical protein